MSTWSAITARNEAATICKIVRTLTEAGIPAIVVDDGSTDDTGALAVRGGARCILHHAESQGIGRSLMQAWRQALAYGADYVVQLDAGGSHNPAFAAWMLDVAQERKADLLLGTRFGPGAEYRGRKWRALASRVCGKP